MTNRTLTIIGLLAVLAVYLTTIGSAPTTAQTRPPVPWHEDTTSSPPDTAVPVAEPATAAVGAGGGTLSAEPATAVYGDVVTLPVVSMAVAPGESAMPVELASMLSISNVGGLSSEPAAVVMASGGAMPVELATASVGDVMLNGVDVVSVAAQATSAVRASPWQPWWESFATDNLDVANTTAMLLACDDDAALREHLAAEGLTLSQPDAPASPTRPLPQDFLVGVTAYEYADAYCQADQNVLEEVEPPAGVTVLRFVNHSDAAAQFALANPDRPYLIYVDAPGLSVDVMRVLAGSNVVGVIVGHYRHADDEPVDFAASVADVMRVTRAVRLVSDAPVLLAVGVVNIHTRDTERSWADAFGDDLKTFDGFALYGLARFPAILEAVENPRELILRRMGLPDQPCILIEFVGTSFQYGADERGYVERVWAARAKPLLAALQKQQWRGLVTWSATTDDARIKANALRNAMK